MYLFYFVHVVEFLCFCCALEWTSGQRTICFFGGIFQYGSSARLGGKINLALRPIRRTFFCVSNFCVPTDKMESFLSAFLFYLYLRVEMFVGDDFLEETKVNRAKLKPVFSYLYICTQTV